MGGALGGGWRSSSWAAAAAGGAAESHGSRASASASAISSNARARTPARLAGVEPAGTSAIFFVSVFCRQARLAGGTPALAILAIVLITINSTNN